MCCNLRLIETIISTNGPILAIKDNLFVTIDITDPTHFLIWDSKDGVIVGAIPSDRAHRFNTDIMCFAGRARHALSTFATLIKGDE